MSIFFVSEVCERLVFHVLSNSISTQPSVCTVSQWIKSIRKKVLMVCGFLSWIEMNLFSNEVLKVTHSWSLKCRADEQLIAREWRRICLLGSTNAKEKPFLIPQSCPYQTFPSKIPHDERKSLQFHASESQQNFIFVVDGVGEFTSHICDVLF